MAATLEDQLTDIEDELRRIRETKGEYNSIIADALEAKATSIRKKLNSTANRKATLPDGTVVSVGDTVYEFRTLGHVSSYNKKGAGEVGDLDLTGSFSVIGRTVLAISADGTEVAFREGYGRSKYDYTKIKSGFYTEKPNVFGTIQSAHKGLIEEQELDLKKAQRELADAQKKYDKAQAEVEYVRSHTPRVEDYTQGQVLTPKLRAVV